MSDLVAFLNHYRELQDEVHQHRINALRLRCDNLTLRLKDAESNSWQMAITVRDLRRENVELRKSLEEATSAAASETSTLVASEASSDVPLVFHSDEWWDYMIPDSLADTTRGNYRFHLRQLKNDTPEAIQEWINGSTSISYKQQRISLAKKIARISTSKIEVPEPDYEWFDVNHRPHVEYIKNYEQHAPLFFKETLDKWTLFFYWLPTRRRDICTLEIVDDEPEGGTGNYYCKNGKQFIWNKYKTMARYGNQRFFLEYFSSFIPEEALKAIENFLDLQPVGRLYPDGEETTVQKFKRRTGLTINDGRHNWATFVAKRYDQEIQRRLASWMAHQYVTAQVTYKN